MMVVTSHLMTKKRIIGTTTEPDILAENTTCVFLLYLYLSLLLLYLLPGEPGCGHNDPHGGRLVTRREVLCVLLRSGQLSSCYMLLASSSVPSSSSLPPVTSVTTAAVISLSVIISSLVIASVILYSIILSSVISSVVTISSLIISSVTISSVTVSSLIISSVTISVISSSVIIYSFISSSLVIPSVIISCLAISPVQFVSEVSIPHIRLTSLQPALTAQLLPQVIVVVTVQPRMPLISSLMVTVIILKTKI